MKNFTKKLSTLFIVAVLAIAMLVPATANAKEREIKYSPNLTLVKASDMIYSIRFPQEIKSFTSSNKKLLTMDFLMLDGKYIGISPYKTTTSKLSFTGKNNKVYPMKLKVVKYTNPVAKFKINSKNYATKFKKATYFDLKSYGKEKISVKAKQGWKIINLSNTVYNHSGKCKTKKIKNNSYINVAKKYGAYLDVTLKNKKTNAIAVITVNFFPQP